MMAIFAAVIFARRPVMELSWAAALAVHAVVIIPVWVLT